MRRAVLLALLLAARAASGDEAVGMNAHIPSAEVVDRIAALGAKWMRVDNNWLDHANPCAANIAFIAPLDAAVNRAKQKGLSVFMTLAYTPKCASRGNSDGMGHNDPPDPALWAQYVRKAVAHYRALGVRHFGLWNEANLKQFWETTAADYVTRVVVPGVPAVKMGCADAGSNDCLVLGPDLAHLDGYDAFLESTLKMMAAAKVKFDILAHHSYLGFDRQIWEGDTYLNGLDMRRFPFTRRSLLDVLRDVGLAPNGVPSIEVWITETGYHCKPPTDMAQMAKQADYYMKVIDAQLARPWYTTTFFYEILDSGDQLDGFGIVRSQGGGSYMNKPAYDALRGRIAKEPALSGGPKKQCSDGADNDKDGKIDLADPGCKDGNDDDESDDPPPPAKPRLVAAPGTATLDGDLGDWAGASFSTIESPKDYVSENTPPGDAKDLSARFAARFEPGALWLAVEVTDDKHANSEAAPDLWKGDSVQVAFDVGRSGGAPYDMKDDFEIGWALANGMPRAHVWHAPPGAATKGGTFAVVRAGTKTTYEVRLAAADLGLGAFAGGLTLGFSLLVNDSDGAGRKGYVQWSSGIGQWKAPKEFGELALAGPPADGGADLAQPLSDGGASDLAATPGDLAAAPGDGTSAGDAGGAGPAPDLASPTEEMPPAAGCGCRVGGRGERAPSGGAPLLALALALLLQRSRRPWASSQR